VGEVGVNPTLSRNREKVLFSSRITHHIWFIYHPSRIAGREFSFRWVFSLTWNSL